MECESVDWVRQDSVHKFNKDSSFTEITSRGSSVSIVSDYGLYDRANGVRSPAGATLTSLSRPALGSTQSPVQWVPGVLSLGQSAAGVWRWPLTAIQCRSQEWVGAIVPLPTSSTMACSRTALLFAFAFTEMGNYFNQLCDYKFLKEDSVLYS
jgi:hypothetical protein